MKLPQFSLRELFWITLVVALTLGWWIDHRQNHNLRHKNWRRTALNFQWLVEAEGWTVHWKPDSLSPEIDVVRPPPGRSAFEACSFLYGDRADTIVNVLKNKPPE
jgi:hypothetical protein